MSATRQAVAVAKIPAVIEHATGMLEEQNDAGSYTVPKLVVFAHHHAVIDGLMDAFAAAGVKAVKLDGRMDSASKQASVDAFQTDASVRVFVGGISAAGVGLTLTAASHMIFAELDWVPGVVSQCEDRCHRIGQKDQVLIQHLVLDGSVDVKLAQAIVSKQDRCDAALDNATSLAVPEAPVEEPSKNRRPARPSKYPVVAPEIKAAALAGLRQLAGL
jgi:SWI/SNF-related matrix-associated actin-dependent regulator 1 of chromatin subfamily A